MVGGRWWQIRRWSGIYLEVYYTGLASGLAWWWEEKARMMPGTSKVIYSRLAMSGIFQSQSRFHIVSPWARGCTWLSCTCPLVSSSCLPCVLVTCPTELPGQVSQGATVHKRDAILWESFLSALGLTLYCYRALYCIIWQATHHCQFSVDFPLKWYPSLAYLRQKP